MQWPFTNDFRAGQGVYMGDVWEFLEKLNLIDRGLGVKQGSD